MLKNNWKSVLTWSAIFSLIIVISGICLGNLPLKMIDVFKAFGAGLIGGFFIFTTFLMIGSMLKDFIKLDVKGKILWVIGVSLIVIYVLIKTF